MAGKSNTTATLFAQKKLLNKAHTSILKSDAQETITTNIQPAAQTTFGQEIPAEPEKTLYLIQSASAGLPGTIEYVQFDITSISGTSYDADSIDSGAGPSPSNNGPHGYVLSLPSNYETLSSNPKAGLGVFDNGAVLTGSLGQIQIIPPVFSVDRPNPYSVTLYKGVPGANPAVDPNIIALESEIDYQLDTFNGVLFVQDYDASNVPLYARAFIYVGDMMSEVIEDINVTGAGGDGNAEYLVLSATGSLSSERVFSPSTGLSFTDGGANNNYTIEIDNSVVATLSGSQFSGDIGITGSLGVQSSAVFNQGITGSLQKLPDGSDFLQAGSNITIVNESDGSITISSTGGGGGGGSGDQNAEYIITSATGSLPNAKLIESGPGISITTGSNSITISADSASITGRSKERYIVTSSHAADNAFITQNTNFAEVSLNPDLIDVFLNGNLLHSGTAAEVSAGSIDYTLSSTGSITFSFDLFEDDFVDTILSKLSSGSSGAGGDTGAEYLVLSTTGSLANERALVAGTGLISTDSGAGGNFTLDVDDSVVATLTSSVSFPNGISGSLTQLTDGSSYIVAGNNISVVTGSNGQLTISVIGSSTRTKCIYDVTSLTTSGSVFDTSLSNYGDSGYSSSLIDVYVNGVLMISGTDEQVGAGDVDYFVYSSNQLKFGLDLDIDDTVSVITTTTGSAGSVTGGSCSGGVSTSSDVDWTDGGNKLFTTSSVSIDSDSRYTEAIGSDIYFFVSGSVGGLGSEGASVFGGDALVSGSFVVENASTFIGGLTGSLTQLATGESFIVGGNNVSITTASNGQITISALSLGSSNQWVDGTNKIYATSSVSIDGDGNYAEYYGSDVYFYVSGSVNGAGDSGVAVFGGDVVLSGNLYDGAGNTIYSPSQASVFSNGISGSLTTLADGTSYLVEGTNVSIISQSNGSVVISSTDTDTTYTSGTGLNLTGFQFGIDDTVVATLTGSQFSGDIGITGSLGVEGEVSFSSGLSGSLTQLSDGTSYLVEGSNISITSQSNGSIVIASTGGGTTYTAGSGLSLVGTEFSIDSNLAGAGLTESSGVISVVNATNGGLFVDSDTISLNFANLSEADVDVASDSIAIIDATDFSTKRETIVDLITSVAGAGLNAASGVLSTDDSIVATLTGSQFSGNIGITGSLGIESQTIFNAGIHEKFTTKTSATGVVTHDCSTGHIFYHTSISADFTANFTNIDLSSTYGTNVTLVLVQGATARIPTAVQVGGSAQTILWQGGSAPSGTNNGTDVVSFSILNNGGSYVVLGQLVGFS